MHDWDPERYLQFAELRTRSAYELLNAIETCNVSTVTDLGCGPGNSTALLYQRYPDAGITGIDSSPAMLAKARSALPECTFYHADIAGWQASAAQDIIFANASLQWLTNLETLLPGLAQQLSPGGTLAVQMPDTFKEPIHQLMKQVALEMGYRDITRSPLPAIETLYGVLAKTGMIVNIWRTIYYYPLSSADNIVEWVSGTGLRPWLSVLKPQDTEPFLDRYLEEIKKAYFPQPDGRWLMRYPRIFIVAQRPAKEFGKTKRTP